MLNSISDKLPIDDDYIYEEFDIPKPDNYEELKEELRMAHSFTPFETPLQNPLKEDETGRPRRGSNNLLNRLKNFFF